MKGPDSRHGTHIVTRLNLRDYKNTRLSFREYIADVVYDAKSGIGYWIVQKVGSAAIIHWGQEPTFDDAVRCAQEFLEEEMRESLGMSEEGEA